MRHMKSMIATLGLLLSAAALGPAPSWSEIGFGPGQSMDPGEALRECQGASGLNRLGSAAKPVRSSQEVYAAHTKAFGAAAFAGGSVDRILEDYADDSVLVLSPGLDRPTGILRGKARIRGFFEGVVAEFRKPGTTFRMEGEPSFERDVVRFSWSAQTPDNIFRRATDTLVIRNGKIAAQTFSAFVETKGSSGSPQPRPSVAGALAGTVNGEALRRHSEAFRNGQVDIVVDDFAPDAVILNSNGVMRGRDELRRFFLAVLATPNPTFKASFATTVENIGFIEWSADGWPWGSDTFVYDSNGKIAIQTFDGFTTQTTSP